MNEDNLDQYQQVLKLYNFQIYQNKMMKIQTIIFKKFKFGKPTPIAETEEKQHQKHQIKK